MFVAVIPKYYTLASRILPRVQHSFEWLQLAFVHIALLPEAHQSFGVIDDESGRIAIVILGEGDVHTALAHLHVHIDAAVLQNGEPELFIISFFALA